MRYFFTVQKFWQYRKNLTRYLKTSARNKYLNLSNQNKLIDQNKELTLTSILELTAAYLTQNYIQCLVLDFDGVLNSHGENTMRDDVFMWLKTLIATLPTLKIFILSNKPNKDRFEYFRNNFPTIKFIKNVRKKPHTDGLEQLLATFSSSSTLSTPSILSASNTSTNLTVNKQNILLIDDRLATGILAAEIFGCKAIFITDPFINYAKKPFIELFFTILRWLEQIIVKIIK